jgi:exonuclease SbcD
MTPFRFMHAADLHLDTPFRGLARIADWLRPVLSDAGLRAWDRLVTATVEEEAQFLILAGDVFDALPTVRARLRLADGVRHLAAHGIEVFWAHGNHDHYGLAPLRMAWPENLRRFPPGDPASYDVVRNGQRLCQVAGISFPTRAVHENYAARLVRDPDAPFAIAVLHANVGGHPGHDNYAPASLADLTASGFDYWALGHIHQQGVLTENPWVVYPGNLQGRHARETGRKGAMRADVDAAGHARVTFRPLNVVRWEVLDVDVSGVDQWDGLEERVVTALTSVTLDDDEEGLVARVRLVGRTPLAREQDVDLDDLAAAVSDDRAVRPFRVIESIEAHWRLPATVEPSDLFREAVAAVRAWDGTPDLIGGPWEKASWLGLDPDAVRARAESLLADLLEEEVPDAN